MARRSLLGRVSGAVLQPPSGPRLGPVHGLSPATASRFMGTNSQGERGLSKDGKEMVARLLESVKTRHEEAMNDQRMLRKELTKFDEDMRRQLDELTRSLNNLRRVGSVCVAAAVAIPLVCWWSNNV